MNSVHRYNHTDSSLTMWLMHLIRLYKGEELYVLVGHEGQSACVMEGVESREGLCARNDFAVDRTRRWSVDREAEEEEEEEEEEEKEDGEKEEAGRGGRQPKRGKRSVPNTTRGAIHIIRGIIKGVEVRLTAMKCWTTLEKRQSISKLYLYNYDINGNK